MDGQLKRLPVDQAELFALLSDARRRKVLQILHDVDTPATLTDLARELVAREGGARPGEVEQQRLRQRRISLYHNHVPKLADADVVEFDADERTVTLEQPLPPHLLTHQ